MMHWIWANKEWLFSGVAVAAIGGIITILSRRLFRGSPSAIVNALRVSRNGSVVGSPQASGSNITQTINIISAPASPQHTAPVVPPYSAHPSPEDIRKNLDRLPVYQRALTKDSFVGLKVLWRVVFTDLQQLGEAERTASKTTNATHDLSARFSESCGVRARVDIEQFPRLKILHEGVQIQIAGEIGYVADDGRTIRLRNATISFDDADTGPDGHVASRGTSVVEGHLIVSGLERCSSEIRFDYLPGRFPDGEGWELVMDQGPNRPTFSLAVDPPGADKCLSVQGFGYRLDYIRQLSESPCKTVRFAAKLWDPELSIAYAYVQMVSRDGRFEKNGWIAHKLGPTHNVRMLDAGEWTLTTPGTPLAATTWRTFMWNLSEEVERTFGTDGGWTYRRLLRIRLRGPICVTPIQLLD